MSLSAAAAPVGQAGKTGVQRTRKKPMMVLFASSCRISGTASRQRVSLYPHLFFWAGQPERLKKLNSSLELKLTKESCPAALAASSSCMEHGSPVPQMKRFVWSVLSPGT